MTPNLLYTITDVIKEDINTNGTIQNLCFYNQIKELIIYTLFHSGEKNDSKVKMTTLLLKILNVNDEKIFDKLC